MLLSRRRACCLFVATLCALLSVPEVRAQSVALDGSSGPAVLFMPSGAVVPERIYWESSPGQFSLTDDLEVDGFLMSGEIRSTGALFLNIDGPDALTGIFFFDDGAINGKSLLWDDLDGRFEMNGPVLLSRTLMAGVGVATAPVPYHSFGTPSPSSGDITNDGDVYIDNDLEIRSQLYLNGRLYMNGTAATGDDGDQFIYFYDGGVPEGESFSWDDSQDRFELTNDLHVEQSLSMGGDLSLNGRLDMKTVGPDGDQEIRFFDGGAIGNERIEWWDSQDTFLISDDLLILGDLRSDVSLDIEGDGNLFSFIADADGSSTSTKRFEWYAGGEGDAFQLMELVNTGGGVLRIGGTLTQNYSFDLAESFWAAEEVQPGQLVRVDPERRDAVRLTVGAYDSAVLGVVSTQPGIVLGGGAFDVEGIRRAWGDATADRFVTQRERLIAEVLAVEPELEARLQAVEGRSTGSRAGTLVDREAAEIQAELEKLAIQEFFVRNFASIALAGRVPVQVDASRGAVRIGDFLVPAPDPGWAMRANSPGVAIGVALEPLTEGRGRVLALVGRAWQPGQGGEQPSGDRTVTRELDGTVDLVSSEPHRIVLDATSGLSHFSVVVRLEDGSEEELMRLEEGDLTLAGGIRTAGRALAEYRPVLGPVAVGEVLVADREHPGLLRPSERAADPAVVGVVAGEAGVVTGRRVVEVGELIPHLVLALDEAQLSGDPVEEARIWQEMTRAFDAIHVPLATGGIVRLKADAAFGAIEVGNLLTTSAHRGHAMKATDPVAGTILGKALEALDTGTGMIEVLLSPR